MHFFSPLKGHFSTHEFCRRPFFFYESYLEVYLRSGGEAQPSLRSAYPEPKLQVIRLLASDIASRKRSPEDGHDPTRVICENISIEWALQYLGLKYPELEFVLFYDMAPDHRGRAIALHDALEHGSYVAVFADQSSDMMTQHGYQAGQLWMREVCDLSSRPLLRIYRQMRGSERAERMMADARSELR
jgi:hypothetical protein